MLRAAAWHVRNTPRKLVGQRPLRCCKEGLHRFLVPHVNDVSKDPLAAQPGRGVLHRVLAQIA
jgi:hypothetical protein